MQCGMLGATCVLLAWLTEDPRPNHLVRLDLQLWKLVLLLVCWLVVALMLGHLSLQQGKYPEHSILCSHLFMHEEVG